MRKRTGSIDTTTTGRSRLRVTNAAGRRETIGIFDTHAEAEEMRAATIEILETEAPNLGGVTLGVYGEKFITRREVNAEVSDAVGDWSKWNVHIKNTPLAKMAVRSIRPAHIREWLAGVRKGRAKQTAQNVLNLLRVIFAAAREAELTKANPCSEIALPKQKRTVESWTHAIPEEQRRLIDASPDQIAWIVQFAMGTGLRAGELVSLRRADVIIDTDEPHIVVRYGGNPNRPTKGGRIRRVDLFGFALDAAIYWLAGLHAYATKNPHGLMFPGPSGGFRSEEHVLRWDVWLDIKKRAGITRRFRWHDLRHTCGTSLLAGWWGPKWSLEEIKEHLGHASITTTERYAHVVGSLSRDAAKMMRAHTASTRPALTQGSEIITGGTTMQRLPKPKVREFDPPRGFKVITDSCAQVAQPNGGRYEATSFPLSAAVACLNAAAFRAGIEVTP